MTKRRKVLLLIVVIGVVILCICGAVVIGYILWNAPLASPLTISIPTPSPVPTQGIPVGQSATGTPAVMPTPTVSLSQSISNCGHSGSMNILVLGVDSPFLSGPNGPLDIRMIKIDFSRKSVVVFSFPRDLWLPISGLEGYGFTQARLGEAYLIARGNARYSIAASTNLVAQNLDGNFGVVSHHYITANLSTLAAIIEYIGGITINIPTTYDGTPYGFHYFPAGPYHMNGLLALEYAIAPSTAAQWSALDRKTLVLSTVFQKLFTPEILPRLPGLIPQFLQVATTDLSLQQITDLICISQQIPKEQITVAGIGPGDVTMGAGGVLYPRMESIQSKVRQFLGS
jgi:anionic cell wall polymer biosynthesis LytR-Cps2A-Psr (LCP) family protein